MGTDQGANTCYIARFGPGKNEAKCTLENSDSTTPSTIEQRASFKSNAVADNVATIKMLITQTAPDGMRDAGQWATVDQYPHQLASAAKPPTIAP